MGRPPGALSGNRRRYPQDWELRDPTRSSERFQEIDSDEDDAPRGVAIDSNNFAFRDARQKAVAGDPLYLDGYDLGQDRNARRGVYDEAGYEDFMSDEEGYVDTRGVISARDETLYRAAMDRIARARAKGKTNVNLSPDEMEILERRRAPLPDAPLAIASPPATPAKKVKAGSRSSSSTNLVGQKGRKKGGSGLFGSAPAKSNSKAKVTRKPVEDLAYGYPPGSAPPGVMIQGPNGMPMYAPLYYGPPSPEAVQSRRRSSSKASRREMTPPEQAYPMYPPHYYPTPPGIRPASSSSSHSYHEDGDWYFPARPRQRSKSNAQHALNRHHSDESETAPMPAAHGRRNASGPPDVRYSTLRRVPPSSSPLASSRPSAVHSSSDPTLKGSTLRRTATNGSSSSSSGGSSDSSEDQGVQVDILPNENGGYSVKSSAVPAAGATSSSKSNGNEARKRKPGGRK